MTNIGTHQSHVGLSSRHGTSKLTILPKGTAYTQRSRCCGCIKIVTQGDDVSKFHVYVYEQ